jgi:AcrR family transcriptional regulator
MAQVLKDEVRERIRRAALEVFAERGFRGATMPEIARRAGVAPANLYRYYDDKDALFAAVVPQDLARRHDELLARSVRSLASLATAPPSGTTGANEELLAFWLEHRHAVVVLLDRGADTRYAHYGQRFVERLVALSVAELHTAYPGLSLSAEAKKTLTIIFDNTRRAIATILQTTRDEASVREAIAGFRSYQIAGLAAFVRWLRPESRLN